MVLRTRRPLLYLVLLTGVAVATSSARAGLRLGFARHEPGELFDV